MFILRGSTRVEADVRSIVNTVGFAKSFHSLLRHGVLMVS